MEGWENDPMTFKRNLHFLAAFLLIDSGSVCLFHGQTRVHDALLLPVIEFLNVSVLVLCFKSKSIRSGKIFSDFFIE